MISNIIKNVCVFILASYSFVMAIYSGYTADNNKPDNSSGLFIASYVICIINCVLYLGVCFYIIIIELLDSKSDSETESKTKSESNESVLSLPTLINIYWIVIYFNYNVSEKYDEYAFVKTIEFFTILGIFILGICISCIAGIYTLNKSYKINKENVSNV